MLAVNGQAFDLINRSERILVITHVSPDGDAIGSLLGMKMILARFGESEVTLACDDKVPEKYYYLTGAVDVVNYLPRSQPRPFDLIIALDCSDERRCGNVFQEAKRGRVSIINIDHHVTNTNYGDINIVWPEAVATTEVLFKLVKEWKLELDAELAQCLLTGVVTDTLSFRTANVTPDVLQVAADLMQNGADLSFITSQTVNRKTYNAIRYWGLLLSTVQLDERVISVHASLADRRACGHDVNGDASIVTFLITAWEADIAVSFVEKDSGQIEISMRAKPEFDVARIALKLGGGGHPAAAGCSLGGPLEQTMNHVLDLLKTARRQQANRLFSG
ncbi:MAG: bifunctional oligoribonuclease/PAP phosphatase NrnA [Anaerolineales bacterium]|nr:bifunctional oligoribonuclease/PAP phosphatase NrnA [Anaerolineales bacterium]